MRTGGTAIVALDPDGFRRLKRLFDLAADLPPEARDDLVLRMCADDPVVRAQLELLLDSESAEELIEKLRRRLDEVLRGKGRPSSESKK